MDSRDPLDPLDGLDRELHDCLAVLSELLPWTAPEVGELESVAADAGGRVSPDVRRCASIYDGPIQAAAVAQHVVDSEVAWRGFELARVMAEGIFWREQLELERLISEALEGHMPPEKEPGDEV